MALSFKDKETDRLAREVAKLTGETLTDAVRTALAERLERERQQRTRVVNLSERLAALARAGAALPDLDGREADEIVGYDAQGLPG